LQHLLPVDFENQSFLGRYLKKRTQLRAGSGAIDQMPCGGGA